MIDSEFVQHLQELHHSGNDSAVYSELERSGGWDRLLSLAAKGLERRPTRQVRPKQPVMPGMELPTWWPAEAWTAFIQMRKAKNLPLTERAVTLIVKTVTDLRTKGQDPGSVIDQSVRKGWTDVYPLKDFEQKPALRLVSGGGSWDAGDE